MSIEISSQPKGSLCNTVYCNTALKMPNLPRLKEKALLTGAFLVSNLRF